MRVEGERREKFEEGASIQCCVYKFLFSDVHYKSIKSFLFPLPPSTPLPLSPSPLSLPFRSSPSSLPRPPQLTAVLVGDDPASQTYVSNKTRDAKKCRVDTQTILRDSSTSQEELLELVDSLNRDDKVHPIVAGSGPSLPFSLHPLPLLLLFLIPCSCNTVTFEPFIPSHTHTLTPSHRWMVSWFSCPYPPTSMREQYAMQ